MESKLEWVESISNNSLGVSRVDLWRLTLNTKCHIASVFGRVLQPKTHFFATIEEIAPFLFVLITSDPKINVETNVTWVTKVPLPPTTEMLKGRFSKNVNYTKIWQPCQHLLRVDTELLMKQKLWQINGLSFAVLKDFFSTNQFSRNFDLVLAENSNY